MTDNNILIKDSFDIYQTFGLEVDSDITECSFGKVGTNDKCVGYSGSSPENCSNGITITLTNMSKCEFTFPTTSTGFIGSISQKLSENYRPNMVKLELII